MKVVVKISCSDYGDERQEMLIDGKRCCGVHSLCECPEDAIIGRSLIACTDIVEYMKLAYEAGKRGEEFNVEEVEEKDE